MTFDKDRWAAKEFDRGVHYGLRCRLPPPNVVLEISNVNDVPDYAPFLAELIAEEVQRSLQALWESREQTGSEGPV